MVWSTLLTLCYLTLITQETFHLYIIFFIILLYISIYLYLDKSMRFKTIDPLQI